MLDSPPGAPIVVLPGRLGDNPASITSDSASYGVVPVNSSLLMWVAMLNQAGQAVPMVVSRLAVPSPTFRPVACSPVAAVVTFNSTAQFTTGGAH